MKQKRVCGCRQPCDCAMVQEGRKAIAKLRAADALAAATARIVRTKDDSDHADARAALAAYREAGEAMRAPEGRNVAPADLRGLRDVCKRVAARAMRADAGSWTLDTCPEERVAQAAVDLRAALTEILDDLAAALKRS